MGYKNELRELIFGMRSAFSRGENAMAYAKEIRNLKDNSTLASLIAYDLQAGSYIENARKNPDFRKLWCSQIAEVINRYAIEAKSILDVGCGEATTLSGVVNELSHKNLAVLGFDISWSRINKGNEWLSEQEVSAQLFVADLFEIPLEDNAIDVVYSSHSLEPNGGRESEAIKELLRVTKKTLILVEPIYELASKEAKNRMKYHGYVKGLKKTSQQLGAKVVEYRLLKHISNLLNPSGIIVIQKEGKSITDDEDFAIKWQCPLTGTTLENLNDVFFSKDVGIVYPVIRDIPILVSTNSIVASALKRY